MLILAILLSAIVLGSHARIPFAIAKSLEQDGLDTGPKSTRRWALLAAPLLLSAGILWLYIQSSSPNLGLANLEGSTRGLPLAGLPLEIKLVAMLFVSLLVTDLMALLAWPKLDRNAWLLVAALGLTALVGMTYSFNAITFRVDPASHAVVAEIQGDFYIETSNLETVDGGVFGTLVRALLLTIVAWVSAQVVERALFATEASWRRYLPMAAAIATAAYLFLLPTLVRSSLMRQQDHLTGLAASLLLGLVAWLPRKLSLACLGLASVLIAVFLHRVILVAG